MRLRFLTYNIHKCIGGIDRKYRPERVIETIGHYEPDVVMLQEVDEGCKRSERHRQVDMLGDALGFEHRAFFANVDVGCGGRYGNAVLSRYPIGAAENIDLTVPLKKNRSVLKAECEVNGRKVHVANMHLGLFGPERKAQLRKFLRAFSDTGDEPLVCAGDLNDVWGTLGPKILGPAGFVSLTKPLKTFPSYAPVRALDGFYVRGNARLVSMRRGRVAVARQASDHLPLIGDVELT